MKKYAALLLLMLFSCYYSGISMFSHVHLVNGASVVHSHLGGEVEHNHSESQYVVIDLLSNFQSETAESFCSVESPFFMLSDLCISSYVSAESDGVTLVHSLRGPPQA